MYYDIQAEIDDQAARLVLDQFESAAEVIDGQRFNFVTYYAEAETINGQAVDLEA